MIDVLIAHSYYLALDPKQSEKQRPYPPLATLYAAAILRRAGYSVALFDSMVAGGVSEFQEAIRNACPRYVVVYEDNFNFLSKMCLLRMREAAFEMAAMARAAGAIVAAAGPDVTDRFDLYFENGVEYALLGEADNSLLELIDALRKSDELDAAETSPPGDSETSRLALTDRLRAIDGLAWTERRDSMRQLSIERTAARVPERKLDSLPLPAWDLVDIEKYRSIWKHRHGIFSLNMVTTRGCPFHCNWCAKPIWGQRYAIRSSASVVEEMALLKRTFAPDHLWFADDIFGLRGQWIMEFAREVAARDARIPFTIQSRVDLMTPQTVAALADAGCYEVWLGAESGSQKILDAMEKGTEVAKIREARETLRSAGIRSCFFIQFGYPGETFEDILATVAMVRDTMPDDIGISVSYPLPGTRFYENVRRQMGVKTNWDSSGDLAMMFQGAYSSEIYRKVHLLLHKDLRVHQGIAEIANNATRRRQIALLDAQWSQLSKAASRAGSAVAPLIRLPALPAAPDLSYDWN